MEGFLKLDKYNKARVIGNVVYGAGLCLGCISTLALCGIGAGLMIAAENRINDEDYNKVNEQHTTEIFDKLTEDYNAGNMSEREYIVAVEKIADLTVKNYITNPDYNSNVPTDVVDLYKAGQYTAMAGTFAPGITAVVCGLSHISANVLDKAEEKASKKEERVL